MISGLCIYYEILHIRFAICETSKEIDKINNRLHHLFGETAWDTI